MIRRAVETLRGFAGGFGLKPAPPSAALTNELLKVVDQGEVAKDLTRHAGWQAFEAEMAERFGVLTNELRAAPLKDVVRLQAQLTELEAVLRYAGERERKGLEARKVLEQMEAESE